ncbi:Mce-associated membrane protein [Herbihabitans rhizosphaerae]|uniref:Mce-associated membrane protein n=1 Tax=Herbihabitans rhizosphaerae TaxID=1872711 RepID=A0A4Q7KFB0_9PSEU|nr:Mce protein [Herbihabitans rhizosphaerae]RZS31221.1 Mce-associated membrane protein [Herbihabitans rhizosphaerae]
MKSTTLKPRRVTRVAGRMSTADSEPSSEESTESTMDTPPPGDEDPVAEPRPRWRRIVLAAVLAVLLGAAGFLGYQWYRLDRIESTRDGALTAAKQYATDLASYDHTRIAENFAVVSKNATEKFTKQYEQVSAVLTKLIQDHKATSLGNVLAAGVTSLDEDDAGRDRAVVVLFVDQNITNTNSPETRADRNRIHMTLVNDGDHWLMDDVQLL